MATTYITRTASANNNSVGKWTFSCWIKRNAISVETNIISFYTDGNNRSALRFDSDDKLRFYEVVRGSTVVTKLTNRLFRDPSAWYHIMLAVDKTLGSPETQIYINGVEETSFATDDGYTQDQAGNFNQAIPIFINAESAGSGVQGICLSHVHFVDGTQYSPTTFGSTDSTTGIWKINTNPSVTYGTNGFFILKDGNSVTDQSGNSNNFTVGAGTLTNTEDNPSNNFPVLNQLNSQASGYTFDGLGSLSVTGNTGDAWRTMYATIGASSGKYYWEQKITNFTGSDPHYIGIVSDDQVGQLNIDQATTSRGYFYTKTGGKRNNDSQTSYGDSWTTNDIVGIALDLDNSKLYFSKNGTWQDSGDPTSGSTGTGAAFTITSGYTYIPATSTYYNLNRYDMNFGNGYFGTTAISSEGTNASNIGKFEYDVPTGYTALCTKGLNE